MPRIRTIKPEFWSDEKLSPMPDSARLLFLALISMADDLGRIVDSPKAIEAFIWPHEDRSGDTREALATLSRAGRIVRGTTASGQAVIQIASWSRHQRVDRPSVKSCLPELVQASEVTGPREHGAEGSRDPRESVARPSRSDLRPTTSDLRAATRADAADPPGLAAEARDGLEGFDAYRVGLTRCANQAITAKWGEQPTPLLAAGGYAHELARVVYEPRIPLDLACETIQRVIERRPAGEGPPRSMAYFRQAILDAWQAASDPARVVAGPMPAMAPEELWRLVQLTGIHRVPFEAREERIGEWIARGVIPDEAAFREAWGMVHVDAARIVSAARDSAAIVTAFRALLATHTPQPMPAHCAHLPHPNPQPAAATAAEVAA